MPAKMSLKKNVGMASAVRYADSIVAKMTLEEKIGQLSLSSAAFALTGPRSSRDAQEQIYDQIRSGQVGAMLNVAGAEATHRLQRLAVEESRLHIPLIFGLDVIHGYCTMFPIPVGEAASWDLVAIEQSARVAATEAAAAGITWTFAPMVDVARDARWGRIMEGAGEDPHLGAQIAAARVRGFQGNDLAALNTVAACAKHYAGYGFVEAGRDYNTADISEATLRNVVLPPFQAAVDAGAASVMTSLNEIGGVPATGNVHLQREILKGEWGFQGFVVSDWGAIGEMVQHGFASNLEEAAQMAMLAGTDMDMESRAYRTSLAELVRCGKIGEALVDEAVRRILKVKFQLGLFDEPYRYCDPERESRTLLSSAHLALARDVARKSIVVLKNDLKLLPLDRRVGTIAVIGPLAADKDTPLGSWRAQAQANSAVSLLEGIKTAVAPDTRILHAAGTKLAKGERDFESELSYESSDRSGLPDAIAAARDADVVVMALGEDAYQTGEGRSQVEIGLKGLQQELLQSVYEVNPKIVLVLMTGRPIVIDWPAAHVPAIVEAWHLGSEAGHAIADVLFGDVNPSGKLPVSFPRSVGQLPLYYSHKNTGRPRPGRDVFWSHYTDAPNTPLYPFGFGLSYTSFTYSAPRLDRTQIGRDDLLHISVTVTNTGPRAGVEIVQLYVRDLVGSLTRPVKELKRFERIELQPEESKEVTFTLTANDLAFYNAQGRWEAEPGSFRVFVGTSSSDVREADFVLR
jgi:beta-glucosidase